MIGSGFLGLVAATLVTLMLVFAALHLLRRLQGMTQAGTGHLPLSLMKRVPIGPKQGVGLLRVADRVLVISIGEDGARLLTKLGASESRVLLAATPANGTEPGGQPGRWRHLLRRFLFPALLLVVLAAAAPGAAVAQVAPQDAAAPAASVAPGDGRAPGTGAALPPAPPQMAVTVRQGNDELRLSGAVGLVVFIGALTLLPALLLLMTSFTRILIVLTFVRPALGTQNAPPMQLLTALAVLLTGLVMNPALEKVNQIAVQPFMRGELTQAQAYQVGIQPFREFMLANTNERDLALFADLSQVEEIVTPETLPTLTLASAFATSELRTAFQMGFLIFVPFIVVDLIVASVLMSLGMFMLPPMMVSLPFKLLLFVLADGWTLLVKNLVLSFR